MTSEYGPGVFEVKLLLMLVLNLGRLRLVSSLTTRTSRWAMSMPDR